MSTVPRVSSTGAEAAEKGPVEAAEAAEKARAKKKGSNEASS
jgi:hypothetical protein